MSHLILDNCQGLIELSGLTIEAIEDESDEEQI